MSAIENVRRQISNHQRSLQILKEQQAKLGIYTPPNIIIDIEDTTAALTELQETLAELEKEGERTDTVVPAAQRRAQIYLDGNFNTVSAEVKQAAIDAFAAVMGISPQEVKLFGVSAGSIIFDIGIPPRGAARLQRQLQRNSAQLRLLKVQRLSIAIPGGITQTWRYDDGKFQPVEASPPSPPKPGFFKKLLSLIRNLLIAGVVVAGGWWAFNTFNPPARPVVMPKPVATKIIPILPTVQREPAQPEMSTEYDTDRPGMDIDNGFPALVDPDNTRGMDAYIEYCQTKCLDNPDCQAYTFLKEKNWCYLKFDVPSAVSDDCCVSGVKFTP